MSTETQFTTAVAESTAAGVPVRFNDESICCRGCYVEENPNEVFALSQHGSIKFHNGTAYYVESFEESCSCTEDEYNDEGEVILEGEDCDVCMGYADEQEHRTLISTVYFYYQNPESARVFTEALTRNGIVAVWDGNPETAVGVKLNG